MQRAYFTTLLVLCTGCFESSPTSFTKEAARERGGRGPDGSDLCRIEGWYNDDICDEFCPEPDPDCATSCPDPDPTDPRVRYVSMDPEVCAVIDYACEAGETGFDNMCGCGCIEPAEACPDPTDPHVRYVSMDPSSCARTDWGCPAEDTRFDNACGCGCISPPAACPDPTDPRVRYISRDRTICESTDWACPPEATAFDDECGCGCISPSAACVGLDEVSCSIDPVCAPTYGGVCDCTCDRAGSGYESGGCPTCPSRCFFFDGCIDTPSVELGCPNPHRIGTRYIGRTAADCAGHTRTECGDEEAFFNNSCGCGCVGSSTSP